MNDSSNPEASGHETLRQEMAHLRNDFSNMKHDLEKVTTDEARAGVKKLVARLNCTRLSACRPPSASA